MNIKPIQTLYNGYKFRSRLEAKWAVFFDNANIRYEYEKEGYEHDGVCYLPDFYLPDFDVHMEVKCGEDREYLSKEINKCAKLIYWGGPIKTLVFLSNVPEICNGYELRFPCISYSMRGIKGACKVVGWWSFFDKNDKCQGILTFEDYNPPFSEDKESGLLRGRFGDNGGYRKLSLNAVTTDVLEREDRSYPYRRHNIIHKSFYEYLSDNEKEYLKEFHIQEQKIRNPIFWNALDKARQARFENGEKG